MVMPCAPDSGTRCRLQFGLAVAIATTLVATIAGSLTAPFGGAGAPSLQRCVLPGQVLTSGKGSVEALPPSWLCEACRIRGGGQNYRDRKDDLSAEEEDDEKKDGGKVKDLGSVGDDGPFAKVIRSLYSRILGIVEAFFGKGGSHGDVLGGSFKDRFEKKYGTSHPEFSSKSVVEALDKAWSMNRLCLIYIASDVNRGGKKGKVDGDLCHAFADHKVASFIDENFILWAAEARGPGAAAAAKLAGARSYPFLGVVHTSSRVDRHTLRRKTKQSTVALHHFNPPPSPAQMLSWMSRVLELSKHRLRAEREQQRLQEEEDSIHRERQDGYIKAVRDDTINEIKEAKEEAQRALEEEKERQAQQAREDKKREDAERRSKKAAAMGPEPEVDPATTTKMVSTIMLRLGDGSRVRRRFLCSDPLEQVFDWADVQGVDLGEQRLASSFPKASFSHPEDSLKTIEEAGLGKQAMLFVEASKPKGTNTMGRLVEAGDTAGASGPSSTKGDATSGDAVEQSVEEPGGGG
ncbi:unnamed protein product [Choristocarpus tenellus]